LAAGTALHAPKPTYAIGTAIDKVGWKTAARPTYDIVSKALNREKDAYGFAYHRLVREPAGKQLTCV
jgi:hypothetical protein